MLIEGNDDAEGHKEIMIWNPIKLSKRRSIGRLDNMFLFPFDKINHNEKIIIYACGRVGTEFARQIELTNYCKILAFCDKSPESARVAGYKTISIQEVSGFDYDKIVVALASEREASNVMLQMEETGIDSDRIVYAIYRFVEQEEIVGRSVTSVEDEIIHIAIINATGLGDAILDLPLINGLRKNFDNKISIAYFSQYRKIFDNHPMIDYTNNVIDEKLYDVVLIRRHVSLLKMWNREKVKEVLPELCAFCDNIERYMEDFPEYKNFRLIYDYAKFHDFHRTEICDQTKLLKISENMQVLLNWKENSSDILRKYGLFGKKYITINRDIDVKRIESHPKLWSKKRYKQLLRMIKKNFPDIFIVQIGADNSDGLIESVDKSLLGKTSLEEIKIILKYGLLNISSEGGMVHLKHYLYGKSAVVFGPTDEEYFGYKEDIKLVKRSCKQPCNYIQSNWMQTCINNKESCVNNVTADMVYNRIEKFLEIEMCTRMKWVEEVPVLREVINKKIAIYGQIKTHFIEQITVEGNDWIDFNLEVNKKFGTYSFVYNIPEFEPCYDVVFIGISDEEDYYSLFHEFRRLLKVGGVIFIEKEMYKKSPFIIDGKNSTDLDDLDVIVATKYLSI